MAWMECGFDSRQLHQNIKLTLDFMKKILSILLVLLSLAACTAYQPAPQNQPVPQNQPAPETSANGTTTPAEQNGSSTITKNITADIPESCLELPENADLVLQPFQIIRQEGIGQATLAGQVKKQKETVWDQTVEKVYFIIEEPAYDGASSRFYQYFWEMVKSGNTVNMGPGNNLGFGLGTLENNTLSSTAHIPAETKDKILDALQYPKTIHLTFSVPHYLGRGAPANFSFACIIE